jgi:hypothetical protein
MGISGHESEAAPNSQHPTLVQARLKNSPLHEGIQG